MGQPTATSPGAAARQARLAESQRSYAADAGRDGVEATETAATSEARRQRLAAATATDAQLRQVATQAQLDPLVLPPPSMAPITAQDAAALLNRLAMADPAMAAMRGATAAGSAQASQSDSPSSAGDAQPGATQGASSNFSPQMLRYLRSEYNLSPKAYRALVNLNAPAEAPQKAVGGAPLGAANSTEPAHGLAALAAASPGPTKTGPRSPAAPSPADRARDASIGISASTNATGQADVEAADVQVKLAGGGSITMEGGNAYNLKHKGPMGWTAFSALVSRETQQAILTLALLRQINIAWQNKVETETRKLELVRTQMDIAMEQLEMQTGLTQGVLGAQSAFVEGRSRILRNENAKASQFEAELGMALDRSTRSSDLRAKQVELTDALRKDTDLRASMMDPTSKPDLKSTIADFVPATRDQPERQLARRVLAPSEEAKLTGDAATEYRSLKAALRTEEDMDKSSVFGRYTDQALQMEAAATQTLAAAHEQTDPAQRDKFEQLAAKYKSIASELRSEADRSGFEPAILTASRANKMQIQQAMAVESNDLEKMTKKLDELKVDEPRYAEKKRFLEVAIEDRQFRLAGMATAVAVTDNLEAHPHRAMSPSGNRGMVERTATLTERMRTAAPGSDEHTKASREMDGLKSHFNGDVVRANLLSAQFHALVTKARAEGPQPTNTSDALALLQRDALVPGQKVNAAVSVLSARDATPTQKAAACEVIHAELARDNPGYRDMASQVSKVRMSKHVQQRMGWDTESRGTLQAEHAFWQTGNRVDGPTGPSRPVKGFFGRAKELMQPAHNLEPRTYRREGEAWGTAGTPAFDPLHRYTHAAGVNMLDDAARKGRLQSHVADAIAWKNNYEDKGFNRLSLAFQHANRVNQALNQAHKGMGGMNEGDADELTGMIAGMRDEFYGALSNERDAAQGLVQQLMALMRAPG